MHVILGDLPLFWPCKAFYHPIPQGGSIKHLLFFLVLLTSLDNLSFPGSRLQDSLSEITMPDRRVSMTWITSLLPESCLCVRLYPLASKYLPLMGSKSLKNCSSIHHLLLRDIPYSYHLFPRDIPYSSFTCEHIFFFFQTSDINPSFTVNIFLSGGLPFFQHSNWHSTLSPKNVPLTWKFSLCKILMPTKSPSYSSLSFVC